MTKKKIIIAIAALALVAGICLGWGLYDHNVDRSGWVETDSGIRYKDFHGRNVTGWLELDGHRYYFGEDRTMTTGWLELEEGKFYLNQQGQMVTGWQTIQGEKYFFNEEGIMLTDWQQLDGSRYYFGEQGVLYTGWLDQEDGRYYLTDNGSMATLWAEIDGKRYYFSEGGSMVTGWAELEGVRYYFGEDGAASVGWLELDGSKYYFNEDGSMYTGWFQEGEYNYYLQSNGTAAVGKTDIEGQTYYFTPHGIHIVLVNPWNFVPDYYDPELVTVETYYTVAKECSEALVKMLEACRADGFRPVVCSAYRSLGTQQMLYANKIATMIEEGHSKASAHANAGKYVAVPGTSEHQLGLALDIVDSSSNALDDSQANTPAQKWLMEHCYEYGFILRFPPDKMDITGIVWEPWHYRYVGVEVALEIRDLGITLEEYLGAVNE